MILHLIVQIAQHNIVNICAQMAYRCIQQIQLILQTELFELRPCCGIKLRSFATVCHIDLIHIFHQPDRLLFTDIFKQGASEIIGDIIFSIGKCSGSTKTTHDRAAFTADTAFNLFAVNRAFPLFQRISFLKYCNFTVRLLFHQLICRKNTSRTCPNNYYIISHMPTSSPKVINHALLYTILNIWNIEKYEVFASISTALTGAAAPPYDGKFHLLPLIPPVCHSLPQSRP